MSYNTKVIWIRDGTHCSKDGIRQPQSSGIFAVLTTMPDAINDPTNHEALNLDMGVRRSP